MPNVISASNLTLAYDGGAKEIIKDATFNIKKGSLFLLLDQVVLVNRHSLKHSMGK